MSRLDTRYRIHEPRGLSYRQVTELATIPLGDVSRDGTVCGEGFAISSLTLKSDVVREPGKNRPGAAKYR